VRTELQSAESRMIIPSDAVIMSGLKPVLKSALIRRL
jgi:hypothetical protein